MILVDPQGPKGAFLLKPLLDAGLPAQQADPPLHAGDLAFTGRGANGTTVTVGIEFKRLDSSSTDLIQSLRSGRLSGEQLPKMQSYDERWLLIEGQWRHNDKGLITVYKGKFRGWQPAPGKMFASELENRLLTAHRLGGLNVRHCNTRADSIRFITALYRWWNDRALDQHRSHLAVYDAPTFRAISDSVAALMRWPGVGDKAAAAAIKEFGSVRDAATAHELDWANLEVSGKKFGKARASKLVTWLREGEK